jgi:hypothetical protein
MFLLPIINKSVFCLCICRPCNKQHIYIYINVHSERKIRNVYPSANEKEEEMKREKKHNIISKKRCT